MPNTIKGCFKIFSPPEISGGVWQTPKDFVELEQNSPLNPGHLFINTHCKTCKSFSKMNENNPLNLAEHCLVTLTFKLQCCKGLAVTHSLCKQSLFIKKKSPYTKNVLLFIWKEIETVFSFSSASFQVMLMQNMSCPEENGP